MRTRALAFQQSTNQPRNKKRRKEGRNYIERKRKEGEKEGTAYTISHFYTDQSRHHNSAQWDYLRKKKKERGKQAQAPICTHSKGCCLLHPRETLMIEREERKRTKKHTTTLLPLLVVNHDEEGKKKSGWRLFFLGFMWCMQGGRRLRNSCAHLFPPLYLRQWAHFYPQKLYYVALAVPS